MPCNQSLNGSNLVIRTRYICSNENQENLSWSSYAPPFSSEGILLHEHITTLQVMFFILSFKDNVGVFTSKKRCQIWSYFMMDYVHKNEIGSFSKMLSLFSFLQLTYSFLAQKQPGNTSNSSNNIISSNNN